MEDFKIKHFILINSELIQKLVLEIIRSSSDDRAKEVGTLMTDYLSYKAQSQALLDDGNVTGSDVMDDATKRIGEMTAKIRKETPDNVVDIFSKD